MTKQAPPQVDMTWPPPAFLPPPSPVVTADGCRRFESATYATTSGYRPRLLDVYVPADDGTSGPLPAVLWIHGGGWMDGDRRFPPPTVPAEQLFGTLLGAGLAVVTLDYRHSLEAPFPAQLHDVKAAIRYVRAFAATLGIDADRIGVWGESAGGHLSALAALTGPDTADGLLEGTEGVAEGDTSVQAAVDWYGVSDIASAAAALPPQLASLTDPYAALLGAAPADRPDLAGAASPVTYAAQPAPPFLLFHGTADSLVPYQQSELLAERLRAQGGVVELVPVDGADHIFLGAPDIPALVTRSVSFLAEHLKTNATR
ncbi:alpha/beta hydrolase [Streptomyces sp. NPDC048623]|uniref:alpha/beta hydrolase n=1 Tax=Streptomyces sp. NPDC048623 TaxID=3155761 RepID=UPI0034328198